VDELGTMVQGELSREARVHSTPKNYLVRSETFPGQHCL
jgi:hypothetical protein